MPEQVYEKARSIEYRGSFDYRRNRDMKVFCERNQFARDLAQGAWSEEVQYPNIKPRLLIMRLVWKVSHAFNKGSEETKSREP